MVSELRSGPQLSCTPTNTEAFCDKTSHLTNCAGGNHKVRDNINAVRSGPLAHLSDNLTDEIDHLK